MRRREINRKAAGTAALPFQKVSPPPAFRPLTSVSHLPAMCLFCDKLRELLKIRLFASFSDAQKKPKIIDIFLGMNDAPVIHGNS
jgi:hypothetical protein